MKKLLAIFVLFAGLGSCATSYAHDGWRHGGPYVYRAGGDWVGPALIGGIIGYELSRPRYYTPPPVIVQQPPVIYSPPVSQPVYPPVGYHFEQIMDGVCNCYRTVLVAN